MEFILDVGFGNYKSLGYFPVDKHEVAEELRKNPNFIENYSDIVAQYYGGYESGGYFNTFIDASLVEKIDIVFYKSNNYSIVRLYFKNPCILTLHDYYTKNLLSKLIKKNPSIIINGKENIGRRK
jgi:hypothetical protein